MLALLSLSPTRSYYSLIHILPSHSSPPLLFPSLPPFTLPLSLLPPVGISQCAKSLFIVVISWTDARHHQGLGVPSQGRLEEACQLRVPIRNVLGLAVHQRRYHVPESRERKVDLCGLTQTITWGWGWGGGRRRRRGSLTSQDSTVLFIGITTPSHM